ncbi:MAG: hypothetical protein ACJ8MH_04805 [Povalibacter sp.]
MNADDGPTLGATALGMAWLIAIVVLLLSFVAALLLRRRYVSAIIRYQSSGQTASSLLTGTHSPRPLQITAADLSTARLDLASRVLNCRRSFLVAQFAVHTVYWLGMLFLATFGLAFIAALQHAIGTGSFELVWMVFRMMTLMFDPKLSVGPVWMTVLFVPLMLAGPPAFHFGVQTAVARRTLYVPTLATGVAFVAATLFTSPIGPGPVAIAGAFAIIAAAVALLQQPRIRGAAAPLIVSLSASLVLVSAVVVVLAQGEDAATDSAWSVAATVVLGCIFLVTFAIAAAIMFALARLYQRKHFSDHELSGWAYWIVTSLVAIGFAALVGAKATLSQVVGLLVCMIAWIAVIALVSRMWKRRQILSAPASVGGLVILRVFKRPARSETFFDRLLSFWRFAGPVLLISGPDLAGANIEPDELFEYLQGKLARRFVSTPVEVHAALESLDAKRDPDGRFRATEFFCAETAWRDAVTKLMASASVVLLDLREYAPNRAGTRFEIYQLMNTVPLEKVVVLLGADDDASMVSSALREAWDAMADESPNRRAQHPTLEICRLTSQSGRELLALFSRLYQCAVPRDTDRTNE